MFQPKSVLSFSSVKYNLNPDEIILLQTLLTQEYFEDIIPAPFNKYITLNTYETTQPIISQTYANVIDLQIPGAAPPAPALGPAVQAPATEECKYNTGSISGELGKKLFPATNKERVYENNPRVCTFEMILTILKNHVARNETTRNEITRNEIQNMTKLDLKEVLIGEYTKLYPEFKTQLMNILNAQGKPIIAKKVLLGTITLENMIMNETYYLTNLDLWLLVVHYNIPMVFLSSTALIENGKQVFVANTDGTNMFYFVRASSSTIPNEPPKYTVIVNAENNITKIDIEELRVADIQREIRSVTENGLLDFIKKFALTETKKRTKMILKTQAKTTKAVALAEPVPAVALAEPVPVAQVPIVQARAPVKKIKRKQIL
jgi:hypothetical protein